MKILFVAPQPFFRDRGTPIRTFRQLEVISEMGHSVDILCYPFGEVIGLPNVRLIRSLKPPFIHDVRVGPSLAKVPLDIFLALKTILLLTRGRYDVVQAVEESAFFCAFLKSIFKCRFVYNMDSHITDQLVFTGFLKRGPLFALAHWLEREAMKRADWVITVGAALSDVVRNIAPHAKILQLEDSPGSDHFVEDRAGASRLRHQLGIGDRPVALYTGNFHVYQGIDLLIRAAGFVARRNADIKIVIAGGTESEMLEKRRLAKEIGASANCIFAGRRPTREMPAFLTMATCLLSPRTLGLNPPLKIYPYMQSGKVIVATNIPSHTQILDDSCAILVEPQPEALADGIVRAVTDTALSAQRSSEALRRLDERYSLGVFRRKVQSMYADIAKDLADNVV